MTGGDADSNDIPCRTFFLFGRLQIYEESFVDRVRPRVCAQRNAESFNVGFHDGAEGTRVEGRRKNVMLASALYVLYNTSRDSVGGEGACDDYIATAELAAVIIHIIGRKSCGGKGTAN